MSDKTDINDKKIPRKLNRNVKLSDKQRGDIISRYDSGEAIRAIARDYVEIVSRTTIQSVIFPERAKERNRKANKKRVRPCLKHAEYMRRHRKYKRSIKDKLI